MCSWCGWENPSRGRYAAGGDEACRENSATYFFIVKPERSNMSFTKIVRSRLWAIELIKIKSSDVQNCVFPLKSDIKSIVCDILTNR